MGLSHTVSGDIASFQTPSRVPIESLKFHFLPKQASGTPSPENPIPIEGWTGLNGQRAGKNLLPNNIVAGTEHSQGLTFVQNSDGSIRITGTGNNTTTKLAVIKNFPNGAFPLKAGTYRPHMWATDTTKSQIYISIMYNNGNNSMYCNANGNSYTYTIAEDVYVNQIRIGLQPSEDVEFDLTIYPSLEKNNAPTSWEPCRSELIPIAFPVAGTNKLDPSVILNNHGHFSLNNGIWSNVVTDERTYIQLAVQLWKSTGTYIKTLYVDYVKTTGRHVLTFTVDDPNGHYICLKHNGTKKDFILLFPWTFGLHQYTISLDVLSADPTTVGGVQLTNIQLEPGDTAHAYEPYSSDNTFYGGYIDLIAGEIVAKYAFYETTWGASSTGTVLGDTKRKGFYVGSIEFADAVDLHNNGQGPYGKYRRTLCNIVPWGWDYYSDYPHYYINSHDINIMMPVDTPDDTVIQFCAWLKTPIHIPVPAEDMKAFLDHNNFWSDANDITEVTYAVTESKDILATRKKAMEFDIGHRRKVRWNQLARDISGSRWRMYSINSLRGTISDGIAECYYVTDKTYAGFAASITTRDSITWVDGHSYYASYMVKPTYKGKFGIEYARGKQITCLANPDANEWGRARTIQKPTSSGYSGVYIPFPDPVGAIDEGFQVKAPIVIDLTLMFGEGNEPTRSEFERICELNGIDLTTYQPYDTGSDRWLIIP